jgi:hypothetical protein
MAGFIGKAAMLVGPLPLAKAGLVTSPMPQFRVVSGELHIKAATVSIALIILLGLSDNPMVLSLRRTGLAPVGAGRGSLTIIKRVSGSSV